MFGSFQIGSLTRTHVLGIFHLEAATWKTLRGLLEREGLFMTGAASGSCMKDRLLGLLIMIGFKRNPAGTYLV